MFVKRWRARGLLDAGIMYVRNRSLEVKMRVERRASNQRDFLAEK